MKVLLAFLALLSSSSAALAAAESTDFGMRLPPGGSTPKPMKLMPSPSVASISSGQPNTSLASAVAVASRLGRVTSTVRTKARNWAVGGAPNSHHLRGRAIDVVRRAGVRHADIEAALRNAGFNLIESLDEGDHSHFAYTPTPAMRSASRAATPRPRKEVTTWRVVTAPQLASR